MLKDLNFALLIKKWRSTKRKELKSCGFRWAPSVGCWQRHRSNQATYFAEKIVAKFSEIIKFKEV